MTNGHGGGRILSLGDLHPRLAADVFVAPGAAVVGDVEMAAGSSLWFNCVARGDVAPIRIGEGSNIQDGSILHADRGFPTLIGADVLIGHIAIIHGCTIQDRGFVGMGAMIMNGAIVESDAMLAAGALLTPGKVARSGQLWAGRPAKYVRDLSEEDIAGMRKGTEHYRENARRFLAASAGW
jgi:carbonic anhydrase/acetyltransferase-like protein (isoleucine patch superfamily)